MPKGASPKREREYTKLETEFKKDHRYPGREQEVAARIVNKQRAEHGETRQAASGGSKQSAKSKAGVGVLFLRAARMHLGPPQRRLGGRFCSSSQSAGPARRGRLRCLQGLSN